MKLLILHGPPAAGKYTTAKRISEIMPSKILHNHLVVDLALSVYGEFGGDNFFSFTTDLRLISLKKAKELDSDLVIMTYCYSSPQDDKYLKRILEFCNSNNVDLYPVHLTTDNKILFERVKDVERINTNKVSDPLLLDELLRTRSFGKIDHPNTVSIDNSIISAKEVAVMIMKRIMEN